MTGHRFALLVATATYEDPKFRQLRAPVHDIEALRAVLEDPQIGDFEVQTLFDAEHWVVTSEMEGFFADRSPEDFCLLFLSCHGVKDVTGRLHFAASTTRFSRLSATGISSAWVNEQLSRSRVKRAVILLDCCYSGAFTRGLSPRSADGMHVVETLEGRGRAVITASDAMEYAWEDDELTQDTARPSIFTRALVSGLGTGAADRDGDGQVTVEDLYGYVHEQVRRETPNQTPTMSVLEAQGDLVVARNPNPPLPPITPDPLPGDLVAAQFDQRSWVREAAVARLRALLVGGAPALAVSAEMALEQYLADRDEAVRGAAQAALEQRASPPVEELAVPPEVTRPDAAEAEGTAIGTPEPQPPEPEPEPAPASDEQPEPGGRSEDHEPAAPVLVAAWARWRALRAGSRAFGATALVMALALGGVGTWRLVSDRTEEEPDADIAEPADTSATDAPDEAGDDAGSADDATVVACDDLLIAFVRDDDIWTRDHRGREQNRTGDPNSRDLQPAWSPDRSQLAFVSDRSGPPSVHVMDVATGAVTRVTDDVGPGGDFDPTWHPDGERIAFTREGAEDQDLVAVELSGPAARQVVPLARTDGADQRPAWSSRSDGRLVFHSAREDSIDLVLASADGTGVARLGSEPGWSWFHPSWSDDGTEIVFGRKQDGSPESETATLRRIAEGPPDRPLVEGDVTTGWNAHWCPVGQQVVYQDQDREGTSQLYVIDLTASDPSPVQLTTAGGSDPAW